MLRKLADLIKRVGSATRPDRPVIRDRWEEMARFYAECYIGDPLTPRSPQPEAELEAVASFRKRPRAKKGKDSFQSAA